MYFTISTNWTSYRWPTPSQSIKGRDRNSRQWSCLWPCSITSSCSGTWFTPQRRGAGDSWFWSARERRSQSPFATIVPGNDFQAYTTDLSQAKVDPSGRDVIRLPEFSENLYGGGLGTMERDPELWVTFRCSQDPSLTSKDKVPVHKLSHLEH